MTTSLPPESAPFKDDDLVYVDPETKTVVGRVEWSKSGEKPLSKAYAAVAVPASKDPKEKKEERRPSWRKHFPFGTYRSMKRVFKVEGKIKDPELNKTLEEVLPKALNEAFWTW
jgi:hypothetical protein